MKKERNGVKRVRITDPWHFIYLSSYVWTHTYHHAFQVLKLKNSLIILVGFLSLPSKEIYRIYISFFSNEFTVAYLKIPQDQRDVSHKDIFQVVSIFKAMIFYFLFFKIFLLLFPQYNFFSTVQHSDPVIHTLKIFISFAWRHFYNVLFTFMSLVWDVTKTIFHSFSDFESSRWT